MIGRQDRWQEDLFVAGPLRDLVPDDHILKRVDAVLDLSWLREEVGDCYCQDNGRPSIDPEVAVRLMLAGLFQGITRDRQLMREAQVNLAIRWFIGYRLDEELPDHSSLTRIRQRWGEARFRRIFERTVESCCKAGLVNAETVHIDATLIRADVSWDSLTAKHIDDVLAANCEPDGPDDGGSGGTPGNRKAGRPRTKPKQAKRYSRTDPDATLVTSNKRQRAEPSYKQHTAVEDSSGVVVDVSVTTGEFSEGKQLLEQIGRVEAQTHQQVKTVTSDSGYAHSRNYAALEVRQIEAVIPPQPEAHRRNRIPLRRFKYDALHRRVRCPVGKVLTPAHSNKHGQFFKARKSACQVCRLRDRCVPASCKARTVLIVEGYEALVRARRKHSRWDSLTKRTYNRHRWRVEGVHGEAKTRHGLGRAARRGLWNVAIQVYLTAAAINLKRLAAFLLSIFGLPGGFRGSLNADGLPVNVFFRHFDETTKRRRKAA